MDPYNMPEGSYFQFLPFLTSFPGPAAEKYPHNMMLPAVSAFKI